jgi:cation diffusion facilitator CzcD-associated flavoprotein CzcO
MDRGTGATERPGNAADAPAAEHFDVIIVGAGLSGIGAAAHLKAELPGKTFLILEARDAMGGTWDLFRYPGIRSDSDMYTLGYAFRPWTGLRAIADGPAIKAYFEQTAAERGISSHIRFGQKVRSASWSSAGARWTLEVERPGGAARFSCNFLLMCSGYYAYARGHRPSWPGEAEYRGRIVHPQFWPAELDWRGRKVAVIGSGATAMTLVPAMAETAAHVTLVQRSPSYIVSRPSVDRVAAWLERWLPTPFACRLARWKNLLLGQYFFNLARRRPERFARGVIALVEKALGADFDPRHFTPAYKPWDQRLCLVPDDDLFRAIKSGRASMITDEIERFIETGIRLASGAAVEADIVVAATGLEIEVAGGIAFSVGGKPAELADRLVYKGMMFADIPNLVMAFGYTNASWTLKVDLTFDYACRLLRRMDESGRPVATPRAGPGVEPTPVLDFTSGYVRRAADRLPSQGSKRPWRLYQNYLFDLVTLRFGRIEDGVLELTRPPVERASHPWPGRAEEASVR